MAPVAPAQPPSWGGAGAYPPSYPSGAANSAGAVRRRMDSSNSTWTRQSEAALSSPSTSVAAQELAELLRSAESLRLLGQELVAYAAAYSDKGPPPSPPAALAHDLAATSSRLRERRPSAQDYLAAAAAAKSAAAASGATVQPDRGNATDALNRVKHDPAFRPPAAYDAPPPEDEDDDEEDMPFVIVGGAAGDRWGRGIGG